MIIISKFFSKFASKVPLEKCFSCVPEIEQFIVVGQGLNQPILLATRSESACLLTNSELRDKLKHYLSKINTTLAPYERISHILITRAAWTIDNGMLTPTLKYHRKTIESCFNLLLKDLNWHIILHALKHGSTGKIFFITGDSLMI